MDIKTEALFQRIYSLKRQKKEGGSWEIEGQ